MFYTQTVYAHVSNLYNSGQHETQLVQTVAPNDITSAKWQYLCPYYFFFLFCTVGTSSGDQWGPALLLNPYWD